MENFCPKCRILLSPKEENGDLIIKCSNCGYTKNFTDWIEHICPKCNYDKAVVVYHAMERGDEGTTTMFRCIKCGAVDKEGYKGG
jgi:DNA-directed RNA polymerase subunit M/transcription elongation factor TFIIS